VVLAFVLVAAISDGEPLPPVAEETPTPAADATPAQITFSGPLPPGAEGLALSPAEAGKTPDIEFIQGGEVGVLTRYFVPVASLGAGVDSLTLDQLGELVARYHGLGNGGFEREVGSPRQQPGLASYIVP